MADHVPGWVPDWALSVVGASILLASIVGTVHTIGAKAAPALRMAQNGAYWLWSRVTPWGMITETRLAAVESQAEDLARRAAQIEHDQRRLMAALDFPGEPLDEASVIHDDVARAILETLLNARTDNGEP